LYLELASNDIELILGVLHSSKIKSKDDLSAITSGELEEIFVEQHASLHRDIKKSLRRIHKSISSADQIAINQIAEDNKRLLKKVEDLERNSKPSDSTTTSDVTINAGGGQAMKQSKAQVNSKTSMNQESSVDSVGLQFTQSHEEQIALLRKEMIHLKEEMGIDAFTANHNLQEEKNNHLKDRLFRK